MYINLHPSAFVYGTVIQYVQSNSGNSGAILLVEHRMHVIYLMGYLHFQSDCKVASLWGWCLPRILVEVVRNLGLLVVLIHQVHCTEFRTYDKIMDTVCYFVSGSNNSRRVVKIDCT
jgi:hypothetical protein